ncbi:hypothetical protein BJV82DRAFT_621381 [Fennellomyces sp. T-0311]|nr:hypothetical protein BJV82DRAFT_621381 [Fennellomyces sp. T-0311]
MSRLSKLPDKVLIRLSYYLGLGDMVALRSADAKWNEFLQRHPEVWSSNHLLFPKDDSTITDEFIRRNIPTIPRSYAVREMRLEGLPLTWAGFLYIFDHFGHSVDRIHLAASEATLADLARHLCIFAGNLALLQHENKIPITFRQYAISQTEYENTLAQTNYMGQNNLRGMRRLLESLTLDDPPFEHLAELNIESTDHTSSFDQHENIHQIYFIAAFLAGRHELRHFNNKRTREDDDVSLRKHRRRQDNSLPSSMQNNTPQPSLGCT